MMMEVKEHVHTRGIIYSDVKLSNMLLCADGWIQLCDFSGAFCEEAGSSSLPCIHDPIPIAILDPSWKSTIYGRGRFDRFGPAISQLAEPLEDCMEWKPERLQTEGNPRMCCKSRRGRGRKWREADERNASQRQVRRAFCIGHWTIMEAISWSRNVVISLVILNSEGNRAFWWCVLILRVLGYLCCPTFNAVMAIVFGSAHANYNFQLKVRTLSWKRESILY